MTTENLQEQMSMSSDGTSTPWVAHLYGNLSMAIEWSGATTFTGEIELQNSLDLVNWNCYGGDAGKITLNAASGYQIFEIVNRASPYFRFNYMKNTESSGTIIIRTYGTPLHPRT